MSSDKALLHARTRWAAAKADEDGRGPDSRRRMERRHTAILMRAGSLDAGLQRRGCNTEGPAWPGLITSQ